MTEREFAEVAVDALTAPGSGALHYRLPEALRERAVPGTRVRVPFRAGHSEGYLLGFPERAAVDELKDIEAILDDVPPLPPDLLELGHWLARRYACALAEAFKTLVPAVQGKPRLRVSLAVDQAAAPALRGRPGRILTLLAEAPADLDRLVEPDGSRARVLAVVRRLEADGLVRVETVFPQRKAVDAPPPAPRATRPGRNRVTLLHGDLRLDLYLEAIRECLAEGRQAVVLAPEIAGAAALARALGDRLGVEVALRHSDMAGGRRREQWREIAASMAEVVAGTRSAVFAPVPELGLVILDEEHEEAFKQPETPRYHAREVALERAGRAGARVLLGSSTPSLEACHAAGEVRRLPPGPRPPITLVDMREELKAGNRSPFSRELRRRVAGTLDRGERVLLFVNRRGYAAVLCRDCGWVARCGGCDLPCTLHLGRGELRCHCCGQAAPVPARCPRCESTAVRHFGAGTERVQAEARAAFAGARVERLDSDAAPGRREQQQLRELFARGGIDILVGTQLAAGLLGDAAFLGVVAADISLNLPDFRAAERTFQLLDGLCRRLGPEGGAVVQTYNPGHYSLDCLARGDAGGFYRKEIAVRRALGYPPYGGLARVVVVGPAAAAREVAAALRQAGTGVGAEVLGPAPGGRDRWQLTLRGAASATLAGVAREGLVRLPARVHSVTVDVDPLDFA